MEIVVPPGGLGRRLDEIESWLAANVRRADFARWGRRRDGRDVAVWGFSSVSVAEEYSRQWLTESGSPKGKKIL